MRSALATVPAAYQVGVDVDHDEAYVAYDRTAGDATAASAAMVAAIIAATGFKSWLKAPGWPATVDDLAVLPAAR